MRRGASRGITRAIVPAAGLGTRLRPLSQAIPKEMLPLGRKPVLEYVLDELAAAGIRRVLLVVSPGKEMVQRYFGTGERWGLSCDYAVQAEMRGLGDAILQGAEWAAGEPVVVAFGDTVIEGQHPSPLTRIVETHTADGSSATVLAERIEVQAARRYGIVTPAYVLAGAQSGPFPIVDVVEKPAPEAAPSQYAVAARWVLGPSVFDILRTAAPDPRGEVDLSGSIHILLGGGAPGWAVPLLPCERRVDIGGWSTYLRAAARFATTDPEYGHAILQELQAGNP